MRRSAAPRGRALGPVSKAALNVLTSEPMTARELAARMQLSVDEAWKLCHRLMIMGSLQIAERVSVEGARRRVAVYRACSTASER